MLNRYYANQWMRIRFTLLFLISIYLLLIGCPSLASDCKPHELYDGYSELGGWIVGNFEDKGPHYSISFTCKNNGCDRLYLSRFLYYDKSGCAHFKAISHISIPILKQDEKYAFECSLNGKLDPEIVAFVKRSDDEYHSEIVRAWRAKRSLEKFERISPKGIVCKNDGFGL